MARIGARNTNPIDIRLIASTNIDLAAAVQAFSHCAERKLLGYPWQGNIRELENAIHHALLISKNGEIKATDLQKMDCQLHQELSSTSLGGNHPANDFLSLQHVLNSLYENPTEQLFEKIEETVVQTAYAYCEYNQVQTARMLGISRDILRHRLQLYSLLAA